MGVPILQHLFFMATLKKFKMSWLIFWIFPFRQFCVAWSPKKNVKLLEVFKKKMSLCWLRFFFTCGMDCYFLNVCPRLLFMLLWTWWQIAWCNLCVKRDSPSGIYVSSFFVKRSALSFICIPGLKKPLDLEKVHFFWEIPRRATNRYAVISTLINHNIIRHRVMAYCLQAPWLFTRNIQIMDLMDEQGKKASE